MSITNVGNEENKFRIYYKGMRDNLFECCDFLIKNALEEPVDITSI